MGRASIEQLTLFATIVFMMAPVFLVIYVAVFLKRRRKHREETVAIQSNFRQELLKAQNEIQEQTLTHVSREIHDNITQVLSFVKLNLALTNNLTPDALALKVDESRKLVAQAIADLRDLSKSLSYEHITQMGLAQTISLECERINKSGIVAVVQQVTGEPYSLGQQRELVLFRIFQEAINNALKHSGARQITVGLQYSQNLCNLTIADNGSGFDTAGDHTLGSGLKNIQNRAALIGAVATIHSQPGKGCCIEITIDPLSQQVYADGANSNSPG